MNHGPSYEILEAWRRDEFILLTSKAIIKLDGTKVRKLNKSRSVLSPHPLSPPLHEWRGGRGVR